LILVFNGGHLGNDIVSLLMKTVSGSLSSFSHSRLLAAAIDIFPLSVNTLPDTNHKVQDRPKSKPHLFHSYDVSCSNLCNVANKTHKSLTVILC